MSAPALGCGLFLKQEYLQGSSSGVPDDVDNVILPCRYLRDFIFSLSGTKSLPFLWDIIPFAMTFSESQAFLTILGEADSLPAD